MTDTLSPDAVAAAPLDLRDRLDYALATIGDTELATVIATAGLAAVHDEWQRTRADLAVQQDCGRALALRIAQLTDEARRWKRRWAGAVVQARHEHQDAEMLRAESAQLTISLIAVAELAIKLDQESRQGAGADAIPHDVAAARIRRAIASSVAHNVHTPEQP